MTKRQLVKWLEAKQSDAKAEVEIQYATAEKAYFAQRDEALKINETVDEVFRLISEADTVANRWKEALEKVEGIDTTCGWYTSLTTKLSDLSDKENIRMYIMKDFTDGTDALRQLKAKRSETLREIEKNYINVIANVESMKNAKTAVEYQTEALRTAAGMNHPNNDEILLNGVMGLCGESGECVDMIKKYRFQGHELDKAHLAKELGDVAWYLAVTAHAIGYDLETVLQMNVDKLRNRYPNGFEKERSLHRQEGDV